METVSYFLNKTTEHFLSKSIDKAKYIAEKLLADTLKIDRLELYLQLQRPLTEEEIIQKMKDSLDSLNPEDKAKMIKSLDIWIKKSR